MERRGDSPHSVLRFIPHRRSIFVVENVVVHFILVARQAVEKDPVVAANMGRRERKKRKEQTETEERVRSREGSVGVCRWRRMATKRWRVRACRRGEWGGGYRLSPGAGVFDSLPRDLVDEEMNKICSGERVKL